MDGVNLSTEVVYKKGQDYRFACYDRGRACRSYRVRFLCGKPGKQPLVGDADATMAQFLELVAMQATSRHLSETVLLKESTFVTQEQWEDPWSWQETAEPHPAHKPFRKGKGLVQDSQRTDGQSCPPLQRCAALCLFGCYYFKPSS